MSGSGSNPFLNRPDINAGTVVWSQEQMERFSLVPRITVRDQFERHYEDIRAIATAPGTPGYAVIAVYDGIVAAGQLAAVEPGDAGGVLVIGRHTSAEMCLAQDPTIALRHLAIRVADVGGEPEARLIDLNTGQGFQIEGAGQFQGARISGPAFVRIGSYGLMLVPRGKVPEIWPARADGVFDRLVSARVVEADEEKAGVVFECSAGGGLRRESVITRVGPPVVPKRQRHRGVLPPDTIAVLTARQEYGQTLYPLTPQHLERGVLLGRYDRCEVELHGLWVNEAASRVHLLLLQDGDRFLVIDTASSNGTWLDGEPVRVAVLPDEAVLELAPGNVVHWRVVTRAPQKEDSPRGESNPPAESAEPKEPEDPEPRDNENSDVGWQPVPLQDDTAPPEPQSKPFDWGAVVGASAWNPADDEELPPVLDLVKEPDSPSIVNSPLPAIIVVLLGVIMVLVIAIVATSPATEPEPEPRQCIHPIHDFGTDSPALRLYLQHQDPDVCFKYRWSPWVQDMLNAPEPTPEQPDWIP